MTIKSRLSVRAGFRLALAAPALLFATSLQPLSAQEKAVPVFQDGEAQVVPAFKSDWIEHDLFVETEFDSDDDGKMDRVHVSVTRPKQTDTEGLKVPVIYQSSPYYAGMGSSSTEYMWNPRHNLNTPPPKHEPSPTIPQQSKRPKLSGEHIGEWVPRGFAVVHSSSPGTGLSQGCPTVGGANESLAPKAVIDWLNGRAKGFTSVDGDEEVKATWCTGKVGMIGTSYNGTLCLAAATTGVEGLECIVPVAPNTSYYHYYRSNGLVRHPGGYMGEDIDVLYDFIHSGYADKQEYCDCNVRDEGMLKQFDRITGDYNEFWKSRDYIHQLDSMKAALFMSHGFNDWNVMPEHSYRIYQAVQKKGLPCKIYYHQAGHGGQPPTSLLNKWFSHFLYNVDNDFLEQPKAYIVREGNRNNKPDTYADYPNPEAKVVTFQPKAGGRTTGELLPALSGTPAKSPAIVEDIVDNFSFNGRQLIQAEWSTHRLIYATPKLNQPLHLSGVPKIKLRVACDRPNACLTVWLVSLPWTESDRITDDLVTRGWADPANAESIWKETPMKPGEFRDVEFELQPDDQILKPGEQLGLVVFSSDRDFTLWPDPGTKIEIDLSQTELHLPIVGGQAAVEEALKPVPVPEPEK
ncbi:MAG: Xaa-Pro dipeptidyl-peptidase [Planctomycetes bacterium]|nr:Xaa-Pro dipeptidyl-peptidase [Planctomycetota bacterium]